LLNLFNPFSAGLEGFCFFKPFHLCELKVFEDYRQDMDPEEGVLLKLFNPFSASLESFVFLNLFISASWRFLKTKTLEIRDFKGWKGWSGWQDSNLRPPAPKAGAIPGYATPRGVDWCGEGGIRTRGTVTRTSV